MHNYHAVPARIVRWTSLRPAHTSAVLQFCRSARRISSLTAAAVSSSQSRNCVPLIFPSGVYRVSCLQGDAESLVTERVGQLGVSGQLSLVISLFGLHLERQGFAEFLELVDGHAFEH